MTNGVHDLDVPLSGVLVELKYRRSDIDRTAIPSLSAAAITACVAGEFVLGAQHCVADFARAIISGSVLIGDFTIIATRKQPALGRGTTTNHAYPPRPPLPLLASPRSQEATPKKTTGGNTKTKRRDPSHHTERAPQTTQLF